MISLPKKVVRHRPRSTEYDATDTEYDELTGCYLPPGHSTQPLFLIVDSWGKAHACGLTLADTQRRQLELGLRASTTIIKT